MEYEPGGVQDLQATLERLIPTAGDYEHNRLNHDSNSHAHQRATIVGPKHIRGGFTKPPRPSYASSSAGCD